MSEGLVFDVRDLTVEFRTPRGRVRAVSGVSFALERGEIIGLVGESGSGKSVTCLAAMGLLAADTRTQTGGEIRLGAERLESLSPKARRGYFGKRLAMIFQDPMTSLNPFLTVERQISEVLEVHRGLDRMTARRRAIESLEACGIKDAARRADQYPHEFSGGMRQRVMIAQALAAKPDVLFADEPTTALDVTTQAQVVELLRGLARETGTAMVFVSHDLAVVAQIASRVLVMYAGRVVEEAPAADVFSRPAHPYTRALARSIPDLSTPRSERLPVIPGRPPVPGEVFPGCAFAPRCDRAIPACTIDPPAVVVTAANAWRRCGVPDSERGA